MNDEEKVNTEAPRDSGDDIVDKNGKDTWRYRRKVIFASLFVIAILLTVLTVIGTEAIRHTIASGLMYLAGIVITGYVFTASAEDSFTSNLKSKFKR